MVWLVSYDKFKAPLVSVFLLGMLCLLFVVSWNSSTEQHGLLFKQVTTPYVWSVCLCFEQIFLMPNIFW